MQCPFCSGAAELRFEVKGYPVLDCTSCGHRFAGIETGEAHVDENYGDLYFTGGGAGYSDYDSEWKLLKERGRMYARKIESYRAAGKVLDVGAAAGYIAEGFQDEGWTASGLEPNRTMAESGRLRSGIDIRVGSLESFETDEKFDLISMIQVAAHFFDPAASFAKARDLLNENGLLLIETWDSNSISARIFGKHWHEYSPPTVLHYFSKDWLTKYLSANGFERVAGARPPKRISGGHIRSLLEYRVGNNALLKLIPKDVQFPYPSEDLFWTLFRKR